MTKTDMMLKLETVAGIGTITTLNGKPRYNFYPDTFNESGLAIAMRTLYPLMDSGDIETITFVENGETLRRLTERRDRGNNER